MGLTRKKDKTKAKLCKERVKSLVFVEEERETYLKAQKKRKITAKKQKYLLMEEQKKEAKKEKRKEYRRREADRAEIAQRVIEASMQKEEETKERIGNAYVTIREL
ncbi:hypothetical protein NEAUS04_2558 [Nematocida ausubeli]|uniref:Uncharacterized protein n=1 Tax=Nematocida ausubeli (strain ATCC PRA-371 / ERTm2) TaxID=1913371 RepID=H8ZDA9_NEMA1|nr:uncharacterized protein NESG_00312 [Nematocida ausubeli]EHY65134.1 hypothetical protein NERG_01580 [Nematocida ausubeli]KAI5134571.1 hypothetical protein NEAUS07_0880 [Nematocida ausubeli]KAI5136198.1 hypothetical protein NEAUS06_1798 [Nematocida ausubeli]KAI5147670.1 hypothetical protein NEAUS05_0959 [Nematocida ausubeli]KAI5166172.1 hypothetical protein NEAUS04_2558 [Nematocida ausubeli]